MFKLKLVAVLATLAAVLALGIALVAPAVAGDHPNGIPGKIVKLVAGQNQTVGVVEVGLIVPVPGIPIKSIRVTYRIQAKCWDIRETHLVVANSLSDIPQTKKGNPKVGKFPFSETHDEGTQSFTYEIQLTDILGALEDQLSNGSVFEREVIIAAHAVVSCKGEETAWGEGTSFDGKNWAMYFPYTIRVVDDCIPTCLGPGF